MSLSKYSMGDKQKMKNLLECAQRERPGLTTHLFSEGLLKLVTAHTNAIGVASEFIPWPLLTAAASFLGINATVNINGEWREPAII